MSMKNPMTAAGIEPANFRLAAQHLNHCATAVPGLKDRLLKRRMYLWRVEATRMYCKLQRPRRHSVTSNYWPFSNESEIIFRENYANRS